MKVGRISVFCLALISFGCCSCEIVAPTPTPTVSRSDAEKRFATHCLKTSAVGDATLRQFNDMSVERIDGFANGCESENKHK
jgi:hypothetical protein